MGLLSIVGLVSNLRRLYWVSKGLKSVQIELSNGTTMHCWVYKGNTSTSPEKPAVLLIHGFGADGMTAWSKQIGVLGEHFDLYIPDLVFFGESTTRSSERSEIFQAECLKSMLDSLQVKSVVAVGHSYGGFVAFWMAHLYPELVCRLVIVSSGICTPSSNDELLKEFGASDVKEVLLPTTVQDIKRGMHLTIHNMPWLPDFIYKDFMETTGGNRDQKAQLVDAIVIGSKNSQPLPLLTQNVLIVWGMNDRIFKLEEAYTLQRHLGEKATLAVIEECGHVPSLEKSGELNRLLLNFLLNKKRITAELFAK
uniref:TSA: Wollemia nobilis Ref_Wollemi_Transcript_12021_1173 transcribed RNA sequence n=1 Tax=Wollemia nobilis TaxID=56998 RepID=A0A0C9QSC4_9CONI